MPHSHFYDNYFQSYDFYLTGGFSLVGRRVNFIHSTLW